MTNRYNLLINIISFSGNVLSLSLSLPHLSFKIKMSPGHNRYSHLFDPNISIQFLFVNTFLNRFPIVTIFPTIALVFPFFCFGHSLSIACFLFFFYFTCAPIVQYLSSGYHNTFFLDLAKKWERERKRDREMEWKRTSPTRWSTKSVALKEIIRI